MADGFCLGCIRRQDRLEAAVRVEDGSVGHDAHLGPSQKGLMHVPLCRNGCKGSAGRPGRLACVPWAVKSRDETTPCPPATVHAAGHAIVAEIAAERGTRPSIPRRRISCPLRLVCLGTGHKPEMKQRGRRAEWDLVIPRTRVLDGPVVNHHSVQVIRQDAAIISACLPKEPLTRIRNAFPSLMINLPRGEEISGIPPLISAPVPSTKRWQCSADEKEE